MKKFLLTYVVALMMVIGIAAIGTAVSSVASVPVSAADVNSFKVTESTVQTALPSFNGTFEMADIFQHSRTDISDYYKTDFVKTDPCSIKSNPIPIDLARLSNWKFKLNPLGMPPDRERTLTSFTNQNAERIGIRHPRFTQLE